MLCAATQGVFPEAYISQGPADTRELKAARPKTKALERSTLGFDSIFDDSVPSASESGSRTAVKYSKSTGDTETVCSYKRIAKSKA